MDGRLWSQFSNKKPQIFQNEHTPKSNWNIVAQAFGSTKKEKKSSHYCRTAIWSPTWPNKHQPPEIPSIDSPIQLPSFYINHPNEAVRNSLTHSERGGKKKTKASVHAQKQQFDCTSKWRILSVCVEIQCSERKAFPEDEVWTSSKAGGGKGPFKSPGRHLPLISSVRSFDIQFKESLRKKFQFMKHTCGLPKAAIQISTKENVTLSTSSPVAIFISHPYRDAAHGSRGKRPLRTERVRH